MRPEETEVPKMSCGSSSLRSYNLLVGIVEEKGRAWEEVHEEVHEVVHTHPDTLLTHGVADTWEQKRSKTGMLGEGERPEGPGTLTPLNRAAGKERPSTNDERCQPVGCVVWGIWDPLGFKEPAPCQCCSPPKVPPPPPPPGGGIAPKVQQGCTANTL